MPDFSVADIAEINLRADQVFTENPADLDLDLSVDSARAILAQQTARQVAAQLQNPANDKILVNWLDTSSIEDETCTDDCVLAGDEIEADTKEYDVPFCREVSFAVTDETLRKSQYSVEETVARALLAAKTRLDNWVNRLSLVQLKAAAGVNNYPAPYTYATGTTTIPAADYNAKMVAAVLRMAKLNRMGRPLFLENGELFMALTQAGFNVGNFPNADQARAFASLNIVSDDFGFVDAGLTEDAFLVRPGGVALFSKHYNLTPEYVKRKVQQNRLSTPSNNLALTVQGQNGASERRPIIYDVFETQECVPIENSGGRTAIKNIFKVKARIGFGVSPSTDATHPAVLSLMKGA